MSADDRGFLGALFGGARRTPPAASAWSLDGGVLRFERDHDGSSAITLGGHATRITVAAGTRVGRGARIHLLGGTRDVAAGATIGESVDIRPARPITIGAGTSIDDFAQLQADAAGLSVGAKVRIGRFTRLWAHNGPVTLGDETAVGPSCTFIGTGRGIAIAPRCDFTHAVTLDSAGGSIEMATGSGVGPNSVLYGHGGLRIGSGVAIAGLTMIVPGNHRLDDASRPIRAQGIEEIPIEIGDDVWIGGGAVVLAGARLGNGSVVGAGAVVRGEVAPRSIVAGVPAREIARRGGG
jgi:acetyltransferase-like isoleucine patch superfamily enzyme